MLNRIWRALMGLNLGADYVSQIQVLKTDTPLALPPVKDIRSTVKRIPKRQQQPVQFRRQA